MLNGKTIEQFEKEVKKEIYRTTCSSEVVNCGR